MKRLLWLFAVTVLGWAAFAEDDAVPQTEGEIWNLGIDQYRAGDYTNALATLRPLMLSRTHGARAAEVVAAIEYGQGNLNEAAEAAQIVLRSSPDDDKANRNFTRAVDRLPEERERKHVEEVLASAQGRDPGSLLEAATMDSRELMKGVAALSTNTASERVFLSDNFSQRARGIEDVWISVRQAIAQSVTNEEQATTILSQIDNAAKKSKAARLELEDMDENAYSSLSDAEHDLTRFLKLTILPPAAIAQDETAQTNAWMDVEAFNGRSWQNDALDFTRSFRAKFPAWARAYEQQAQSDTNKPPFTAEDQAKVSALATELEKLQLECVEKNLPPQQEKALAVIRQIRDLLPKDGKGGGQGQPQPQNNNQQDKNQQQPSDPQDQQQQPPQSQKPQESQQSEEDKDMESVLKKAQERSDEHEAEKKARMRKGQLPPNTRDW